MATITTDLICNLNQPVAATFLHGNLFSQDNAGNTINVHVMDNGEPATIGGTVSANVIRADGNTVAVSGSLSGNQCSVVLPQACYAVPGRVEIIIKLTQSTTITTIAAIVANVYRSTTDTVVDPGTIIPSIQALIEEIEDAVDSIPVDYSGLLATIAADYSSSKTYQVGQYAWQGGVLKRCIVPITTAETYTAAHWTNAVIGDDLSALKSALVYTNEDVEKTKIVLSETLKNTSKSATVWFNNAFMAQKDVSVVLDAVSGVDESSVTNLITVYAYYTDNTNSYIYVTEKNKVYRLALTAGKTISSFSIVGGRASAASAINVDSSWTVTIWEGEGTIRENKRVIDALKISGEHQLANSMELYDFSNASSKWFPIALPTGYDKLYIAYTDIGGINESQDYYARLNISYSSGNDTQINLLAKNTLYAIESDQNRTVTAVNVVLLRGTVSARTYSFIDIAIYGQKGITYTLEDIVKTNDLISLTYENKAYYQAGPSTSTSRIATGLMQFGGTIVLSCDVGYEYGFVTYSDTSYNNFSDTGWLTRVNAFSTDRYFAIVIRHSDNSAIKPNEGTALHIQRQYDIGSHTLRGYTGIRIDTRRNPVSVSKSVLTRTIPSGYTTQAGSIFGKYLVQGYSSQTAGNPAYIEVYNLETNAKLFGQTIDVNHFGSASFSDEWYDSNDVMPLLYVTGLNEHIYALRISESTATIVKDISIPESECGYYQGAVVDAWNNYLYVFGYNIASYTDGTNNYIKVTKYNLSNLTTSGGTTTAELLEQFTIPFIYCFQDLAFYKGKIFIASGFNVSQHPSALLVFNPATKAIETEIAINEVQSEPEMIAFYGLQTKDVLYYQSHSTQYTIIDFI